MKPRTLLIGIAAVIVLAAGWLWLKPKARGGNKGAPAVAVDVATVTAQDVPVYVEGLGTVQAFYTVQVTARVDGQVEKVAFTEGQDVRKGALLAQIDARPFQAALEGAIAARDKDKATLANAHLDMQRYQILAPEDLIICKAVFDRPKDWLDIEEMLRWGTHVDAARALGWVGDILGPQSGQYARLNGLLSAGSAGPPNQMP